MTVPEASEGVILLVDDDPDEYAMLRGYQSRSALRRPLAHLASGRELLEYLEEVQAGSAKMPSLVLLDVNMPELNGHETLAQVRANPAFAENPPVIMFTTSADPADRARAEACGAGYAEKPSNAEGYVDLLNSLA